jgi:organic radical activating enzyme
MTDSMLTPEGRANAQCIADAYPRRITSIHQIEVSTHCNLRCVYCPSPKLEKHRGQPKTHMTLDVFERALEWAAFLDRDGTQGELSITGIGETLLHPQWQEMIALARSALPHAYLNFSTNGLLLDDAACEWLARCNVKVFVSLHRPEKAGPAIERAKRHGILQSHNAGASVSSFDWAGQVDWHVSAPSDPCEWLRRGWGNVLVDGRISTCCLDATGDGTVAHVQDDPAQGAHVAPWSLCASCHMTITEPIGPR